MANLIFNHGLKLDFFPFIDFNKPSNLTKYLSNKTLFFVILYKVILSNILINNGVKIIDESNFPYFFRLK